MDTGILSVGAKAELEFFNSLGSKIGATCTGTFTDILNDREAVVFSSGHGRLPTPAFSKIRVRVSFRHPLHGLLKFEGVLNYKEETRDGTRFYIKTEDNFQEIQRREYFRPDCSLKAAYRLVKDSANELPYKAAETRNISFKGVCILLKEADSVCENDFIDLIVWLQDNLSIQMRCRVVRIVKYERDGKENCELGLSVEEMDERDRAVLTKYITEKAVIGKS